MWLHYSATIRIAGSLLILLVLSAGLVACGRTLGPVSLGATGTPGQGTPSSDGSTVRSGQGGVTLALDSGQYTASNAIVVTIHNTLSSTIVTTDHQSQCSIVTMERSANGTWTTVDRCQQMIMTRMIPLAAGSATQVRLTPRASGSNAPIWPAGTYRIVFHYATGPNSTPGVGNTVYSAAFSII